jgi:hypothetical protein
VQYRRLRPPLRKREQARLEALAADGEVVLAGGMSTTPGRQMRVAATISRGPSRGERRLAMREARATEPQLDFR